MRKGYVKEALHGYRKSSLRKQTIPLPKKLFLFLFVLFLPYVKQLFKKNKQNKPEDKQQEEYSFPVEIAFDYHLSNTITVAMAK